MALVITMTNGVLTMLRAFKARESPGARDQAVVTMNLEERSHSFKTVEVMRRTTF
jgi:hypothetical protein